MIMIKRAIFLTFSSFLTLGFLATNISAKELIGVGINFKLLSIVVMEDNRPTGAGLGLVVDSLVPGSPAEKAGVIVGDELVSIYQYNIVSTNGNRIEILPLKKTLEYLNGIEESNLVIIIRRIIKYEEGHAGYQVVYKTFTIERQKINTNN